VVVAELSQIGTGASLICFGRSGRPNRKPIPLAVGVVTRYSGADGTDRRLLNHGQSFDRTGNVAPRFG
jgi:hypothetical protein